MEAGAATMMAEEAAARMEVESLTTEVLMRTCWERTLVRTRTQGTHVLSSTRVCVPPAAVGIDSSGDRDVLNERVLERVEAPRRSFLLNRNSTL